VTSQHPLERLLPLARSPQQYTGCDLNADDAGARGPLTTIIYPDTYELGMSNFGLSVVRHLLLSTGRHRVRRAYCPAPDMLEMLRSSGTAWPALEDGAPVAQCDVMAFGVPCEILFPNVLVLLDLAGLPLRSEGRGEGDPLVVAGGGGLSNPLPLSPFMDAFFLGEAEAGAVRLFDVLTGAGDRRARLEAASRLPGVWVPSLGRYPVTWVRAGSLSPEDAPVRQVVPLAGIVHDRAVVEIARGCTRGCRFCQASHLSRPVRERSVEEIAGLLRGAVAATGWEDAGLLSLSFSDYSDLPGLLEMLESVEGDLSVNISRPSLRPDSIARLEGSRIAGRMTIAPEAGSERLRRSLNKDLTDEVVLDAVSAAFRMGATGVKLYFMVGLPGETYEDLEALASLASRAAGRAASAGRGGQVSISLSPFVPKPHTPLQHAPQVPPDEVRRRLDLVRSRVRGCRVGWNDPDIALLEGVFGLGDDVEVPGLLERAVAAGAGFEGWRERFRRDLWAGLLPAGLLGRLASGSDPSIPAPWSFVRTGVDPGHLVRELEKYRSGELTPDCREGVCHGCGACGGPEPRAEAGRPAPAPAPPRAGDVSATLRVRFSRLGPARFSSQLDIVRMWMRSVRRSGLPHAVTSGHVRRPRLRFGPALPLGYESVSEYVDILLTGIPERFALTLPRGFAVEGVRLVAGRIPSPEGEAVRAGYEVRTDEASAVEASLREADGLVSVAAGPGSVIFEAVPGSPASRPDRLPGWPGAGSVVRRTAIRGRRGEAFEILMLLHEGDDRV
jgi:hypothetical protein